jgi:hypothetical protein
MNHPETHKVTRKNGTRPAGKQGECFYCHEKIGNEHKPDCVLRKKTVVIRLEVEYVVAVPESWDSENINFHRNMGSWCAGNVVGELEHLNENMNGCLCNIAKFEYIRDATESDELSAWGGWVSPEDYQ